jgi:hypothetical protein
MVHPARCVMRRWYRNGALATQRALGKPRPCVDVLRRDHDPLAHRTPLLRRVEERGAFERERSLEIWRIGELEHHCVLPEAADHLAALLDRRHAHHLAEPDVVVLRLKAGSDLVVPSPRVHLRGGMGGHGDAPRRRRTG